MASINIPHIKNYLEKEFIIMKSEHHQTEILNQIFKNFSNSIFYPAGGTDLQVLLRFSSIVNTVVSPTLSHYLNVENYDNIFRRKCSHLNTFYNSPELEYLGYEIHSTEFLDLQRFNVLPEGLLNDNELQEYNNELDVFQFEERYIAKFNFKRKVGDKYIEVSWIAMNTEGLATLAGLIHVTKVHPKILCTIQQGDFEYSDGLFIQLVNQLNLTSIIWLRGFWLRTWSHLWRKGTASSFPPYSVLVQDYCNWYSPMGETASYGEENYSPPFMSKVCAFARDEFPVQDNVVLQGSDKQSIKLVYTGGGNLHNKMHINKNDLFITSKRTQRIKGRKRRYWEDYFTRKSSSYPGLTLKEALSIVQGIFLEGEVTKIGITPIGFEDEANCILDEFVKSMPSGCELVIQFIRPFDFIKYTNPYFLLSKSANY